MPSSDKVLNCDFSTWKKLKRIPDAWGGAEFGVTQAKHEFSVAVDSKGRGLKQTWRAQDADNSIYRMFGVTLEGIDTTAVYRADILAELSEGMDVTVSVWGEYAEGNVKRVTNLVELKNGENTFFFESRVSPRIRIVASCRSAQFPASIYWKNWQVQVMRSETLTIPLSKAFSTKRLDDDSELAEYTALSAEEDLSVLDSALNTVFGEDSKPAPSESTVLQLMSYSAQILQPGEFVGSCGSAQLQDGHGLCEGRSTALVSLCRRLGMPARKIQYRNIGSVTGTHVVAEVYYDGGWHLFDPSYASFFYSEPEYSGNGRIFSGRALIMDPNTRIHPKELDITKFTGVYSPYSGIRALTDTEAQTLYTVLFTRSFPNQTHENGVGAVYPVEFDLIQRTHVDYGKLDGQTIDVYDAVEDGSYVRYRGDMFLGATPARASTHLALFRLPEPGTCCLTYYFRGNALKNCLGVVELKGAMVISNLIEDVPGKAGVWKWTVTFTAMETDPMLLVELRQVSTQDNLLMALPVDAIAADFAKHSVKSP